MPDTIFEQHLDSEYSPPAIRRNYLHKHIISVDQFSVDDLEILFEDTVSIRNRVRQGDRGLMEICAGKVMALLFYESSTRTDLSFQSAMRRLGGDVITASNGIQFSSIYKGENLADTVRAAGCFADAIILRHPEVGASSLAAQYLDLLNKRLASPSVVISGGDGIGEHPTQALLDMFTIIDNERELDGLTITMVGDLKHGRTVHSLAKLIAMYQPGVKLCFVSPASLKMPIDIVQLLQQGDIQVYETDDLHEVLSETDVIYWTRVQEERFTETDEYERIKNGFIMTPSLLQQAKPDAILMHPLPRKHEMGTPKDHDILDIDKRSIYFEQMENGMFVRMALLAKVLKGAHV